jgi:hypothetical protein
LLTAQYWTYIYLPVNLPSPVEVSFDIRVPNNNLSNARILFEPDSGYWHEPTFFGSEGDWTSGVFQLQGWYGKGDEVEGIDYSTTQRVHLLLTDNGNGTATMQGKIWPASSAEPVSWQTSYTDAQSFPVRYLKFQAIEVRYYGETYVDDYVEIDNLSISGVNACSEYRFDNFNRTVASGWGTSDLGLAWTASGLDSQRLMSVDGSQGIMSWVTATGGSPQGAIPATAGPWVEPSWEMTARVRIPPVPASGNYDVFFRITNYARLDLFIGSPNTVDIGYYADVPVSTSFTWASGQAYFIRWAYTYNGTERVKVWLTTDPEPAAWLAEANTAGVGGPPATAEFDVRTSLALGSSTTNSIAFDYIDFDYDGKPCYQDCSGNSSGPTEGFDGTELSSDWTTEVWDEDGNPRVSVAGGIATVTIDAAGDGDIRLERSFVTLSNDLRLRMRFDSYDSTSDYTVGRVIIVFGGMFFRVFPWQTGQNFTLSYGLQSSSGRNVFVSDEWYNFRFWATSSSVNVYWWSDSQSEPSQASNYIDGISPSPIVANPDLQLRVENYGAPASVDFVVSFDSLDVAGVGACVTDSFNRADSGSLGISDAGYAWSKTGSGSASIVNNKAVLTPIQYSILDVSSFGLHSTTVDTKFSLGSWADSLVEFAIQFKGPSGLWLGDIVVHPGYNPGEDGYLTAQIFYKTGGSYNWIYDFVDIVGINWQVGTSIDVRTSFYQQTGSGNSISVLVRETGTTDSDWIEAIASAPYVSDDPRLTSHVETITFANSSATAYVDYVDVWSAYYGTGTHLAGVCPPGGDGQGGGCLDPVVPGGDDNCPEPEIDPVPASGYTCEEFTGSAGTRVRQLSRTYTVGSVSVWVNGIIQTNFSAPGGTMVTLGFDTVASDTIKICYNIGGSGTGWDTGPVTPYPMPI